jgi:predicted secreted hydrolase
VIRRRALLAATAALPLATRANVVYPRVVPRALEFPRDHGAHPDYRTEWWYLTGWLERAPQPLGFQVTFFRLRPDLDPANPSRFAAHQLLAAHVALADPPRGALQHEQRIARAGFDAVAAAVGDTDVSLERWRLSRHPSGAYACAIEARAFALQFEARPTQPLLAQGIAGHMRKSTQPEYASYYYSIPQLAVQAHLTRDGRNTRLAGRAWLDHEWGSTMLDSETVGWDWAGINLDDGGALTAYRLRRRDGTAAAAYASLRDAAGTRTFAPHEVRFEPLVTWTSPRTRATYPIAQRLHIGSRVFETRPLFDDQELDGRATTGAVYWEGASELLENGRRIGRGYLELTGYVAPLRL